MRTITSVVDISKDCEVEVGDIWVHTETLERRVMTGTGWELEAPIPDSTPPKE